MKLFFQITQNAHWFIAFLSILGSSYVGFDIYKTLNRPSKQTIIENGTSSSNGGEKKVEKSKPFSHYAVISRRNLFSYPKDNDKEKPVRNEAKAPVPQSELRLALKGTIIGSPENTFAIIEELDKKKERLYHLHDKVKDAEIVKIQRERIIISRAGKEEMLLIFQEKKSKAFSQRGKSRPPAKSRRRRLSRSSEGDRNTKVLKREDVVRGTSSIQRLMTQLRIKPHFSSGNPDGFMISHIQKGSLVERAGLQNGDVIKGINDIKIDSPSELLKAYRNLNDASLIEIEIEREGQKRNISIKVE
jgi:general secretion pathway protein C